MDGGRVEEEYAEGGARREESLFRDWVVCRDDDKEEENKSDVSESKGSGFHCASLWNPFSPLVWADGVDSDLAASGGRAWVDRERGGGLGEARLC